MNGVLVLDKPQGWSSFDVVRLVKKKTRTARVGHAGTLDPMATGVLVVCVGDATKLVPYLMDAQKEYQATLRLGIETDTDDADSGAKTVKQADEAQVKALSFDLIQKVIQSFIGHIVQIPPRFSALKDQGVALYRKARTGADWSEQQWQEKLQEKARAVDIHDIFITKIDLPEVSFTVRCGKGVYVRALARDVGRALGVGAHLTMLRRTRSGAFGTQDASVIHPDLEQPEMESIRWFTPAQAVAHLPCVVLADDACMALRQGQLGKAVEHLPRDSAPNVPHVVLDAQKNVVAIVEFYEKCWHINRVMCGSS